MPGAVTGYDVNLAQTAATVTPEVVVFIEVQVIRF